MHEYSITCSIIEILKEAVKENNIKRIKKINFRLSPLSHIEPQSIEFYYNFLTKNDYKLKMASLNFKRRDIAMKCVSCGKTFKTKDVNSLCPYCSSDNTRLIEDENDDEIKIVSIET